MFGCNRIITNLKAAGNTNEEKTNKEEFKLKIKYSTQSTYKFPPPFQRGKICVKCTICTVCKKSLKLL